MKEMMFTIGLPRSGSTVLMNILQENPEFFTTGTCPIPYLIDAIKIRSAEVSEFLAMDMDVLSDALEGFIKQGTDGWFNSMTDKPTIISKSRTWDTYLPLLFKLYKNPKFIVCIRDPRDIICSFEKLLFKYPYLNIGDNITPFHMNTFDERIKSYILDRGANYGRAANNLRHIYEMMQKYPNNFFLFRFEDFNRDPNRSLNAIYQWMDKPTFTHDLNNIKQSEYVESSTPYRALVSHTTHPKFQQQPEHAWKSMMNEHQSNSVLLNERFIYETFYPEIEIPNIPHTTNTI